jgi:hypothetical protein
MNLIFQFCDIELKEEGSYDFCWVKALLFRRITMSLFPCLQPQNNEAVEGIIRHIDSQLEKSSADVPFQVDARIADAARKLFCSNFRKNRIVSRTALFFKISGSIGLVGAVVTVFSNPLVALSIAAISAIALVVFAKMRNPEGYRLQDALHSKSEDDTIRQLSLGANIYQWIYFYGDAAPGLLGMGKGAPIPLCKYFAEQGQRKVLAYLLMMEKDSKKRAELATQAIPRSKDIETAQHLLAFGAKIKGNDEPFYFYRFKDNLDLAEFFVERGLRIDGGIDNYEEWQAGLDRGVHEFDNSFTSVLGTPLEALTTPTAGPEGLEESPSTKDPRLAFKALRIAPSVYTDKATAEELYHALNKSGARIRLSHAKEIFDKLHA